MFNSFSHQKKINQELQKKQKQSEYKAKNKKLQEQMCIRYAKRVNKFIRDSLQTPKVINEYKPPLPVSGRNPDPKKFKGKGHFVIKGYLPQRKRIQNTIQNYRFLSTPLTEGKLKKQEMTTQSSTEINTLQKTYFKGLQSILSQRQVSLSPPVFAPSRSPEATKTRLRSLAKQVLQSSNISPRSKNFLKIGQGALCSSNNIQ